MRKGKKVRQAAGDVNYGVTWDVGPKPQRFTVKLVSVLDEASLYAIKKAKDKGRRGG